MVEIRELVIKTTISEEKRTGEQSRSLAQKEQDLINRCVEEVLRILKREKER